MYAAAHVSSLVVGNSTAAYYGFNSTMAIAHIQRDAAAPSVNSFVTGNSAAVHGKCAAICIHTATAISTGRFIFFDGTAVHSKCAVHIHTAAIAINTVVTADGAAVHDEGTIAFISAANIHAPTGHALCMGDASSVLTVAQYKGTAFSKVDDRSVTSKISICTTFCNTLAIQAEVEGFTLPNFNRIFRCHVIGQVDVGGVIAIVCNVCVAVRSRAIPSCPGNSLTGAGMVADVDMCLAADGVTVPLHFRRGGGDHHAEQGTQAQGQGQE